MTTWGNNQKFTVVAAVAVAQFRGITLAGSYATSGITCFGINEQKPSAGDHVGAITWGGAKLQVSSGGLAVDDEVSIVASGYGTKCLSGFYSIGRTVTAATSGGIAEIFKYSAPAYINA